MPIRIVRCGPTLGQKPPIRASSIGSCPSSAATGMPCTLPLRLDSGVFMSPWASTQMRLSGRPTCRAYAADAATDPAPMLWSPPSTSGRAPSVSEARADS